MGADKGPLLMAASISGLLSFQLEQAFRPYYTCAVRRGGTGSRANGDPIYVNGRCQRDHALHKSHPVEGLTVADTTAPIRGVPKIEETLQL